MKKNLLTALMASAMLGVSTKSHAEFVGLQRGDAGAGGDDDAGAGGDDDTLNTKLEVALPRRNGRNYYPAPTVGANYMGPEGRPSRPDPWDPGDDDAKGPTPSRMALDAAAAKRARKAARLANLPRPRGDVP